MINREIIYERDINKSYMKIPAVMEPCFDEKLMIQKKYTGCIPMEKCFVNGQGQYWYNITGKQALDAYCRINPIGLHFFETLILRICSQLEILEWNLIDTNCLMIDPELIFLNSRGEELSFVLYPCSSSDFFKDLQQLMEYLLTKLDHGEKEAVQAAYHIYEITLSEVYSIADLKNAILKNKADVIEENTMQREDISAFAKEKGKTIRIQPKQTLEDELESVAMMRQEKSADKGKGEGTLAKLLERTKQMLHFSSSEKKSSEKKKVQIKEEIPDVVYPEEEEVQQVVEIHPTVCMASSFGEPKGLLLYEGCCGYMDFELRQAICFVGKSQKAHLIIDRETISQLHAKIEYTDGMYHIEDMNSTNGTFINDLLLNYKERKILQPGDVVRFADIKYRFW